MKNNYTIEHLPMNQIYLNEKNPRFIMEKAFKRLVKSLNETPALFEARPLLCSNRTGKLVIIGGNMRYLAAEKLNYTEVPVIIMTGLTEAQEKAISILDNGTFGEWDFSTLASDWSDLPLDDWGVNLPKNWLEEQNDVVEDDFNAKAEAEKIIEPVTQIGDVWLLGKHRIMCGDATKEEDVDRLMGPQRGGLLLTDPPYGVNIVGKIDKLTGKGRIGIGKRYSPVIGDEAIKTAKQSYQLSQKLGIKKFIFWGGNYFTGFLPPSPCWIIWDKRVDNSSNDYADGEIAWTSFKSPARIYRQIWDGYRREGNRDVEGLKRVHPTQKPVGLFAFCINNYSKPEEIILDFFLGSGSTLIAAEQFGRICYGMEISPTYCDIICKRWQDFTGNKPVLKQNGR